VPHVEDAGDAVGGDLALVVGAGDPDPQGFLLVVDGRAARARSPTGFYTPVVTAARPERCSTTGLLVVAWIPESFRVHTQAVGSRHLGQEEGG